MQGEELKNLPCDPTQLKVHRGTHVKMLPVTLHPAFVARIERFERIAQELGQDLYGRAPRSIRHLGGYACRPSRLRPQRISEHALGNAIDVAAFDFPALPDPSRAPQGLPRALWGPFRTSVQQHWTSRGGVVADLHQKFLQRLTEELAERDVFRVLLGPSHPGHHDHFHFDMSPWTYRHL
jgi:hypothetical protein